MKEHALQIQVAHMLTIVLDPEESWWSGLDHAAQLSARYGAERKRRGIKRGLPDFIVMCLNPFGPHVFGIEIKVGKGRLSPEQIETAKAWARLGYSIYVARSLEEVQHILEQANAPMLRRMNFLGGGYERLERPATARHQRPKRRRKPKGHLPVVLARKAQA